MRVLVLLVVMVCIFSVAAGAGTFFHVSRKGNDKWTGKLTVANRWGSDGPFATLERARDAIRELKVHGKYPDDGVTVFIHGGTYEQRKSFELNRIDSGTPNSPVTYQSYKGEKVTISGGATIPDKAFTPVRDDAILKRLDPASRDKVLQADLKSLGITYFGDPWPENFLGYTGWPELFYDGKVMQLARWPNDGYASVAKVIDRGSMPRYGEAPDRPGTFQYDGDRPSRWLTAPEVYLNGFWAYSWFANCMKVAKIDTDAKTITFTTPHQYGLGGPSGGVYYAMNVLEELDTPGEYYLDRNSGILYFWPPEGLSGKDISLSILPAPIVLLKYASYVNFQGLTFQYSCGEGIKIQNGDHNTIAGCSITNIANTAVNMESGTGNGIVSSDIYNLGAAGIILNGGDRKTLTPSHNYARNNHIHHYGRLKPNYEAGIILRGVGGIAENNEIHDAPHRGIGFGGNDHLIQYNHVHHVGLNADDVGGIGTGGDWSERGTTVRYNLVHDIGSGSAVGNICIYMDTNTAGISVYGNIMHSTRRGMLVNAGRDNLIENNIIAKCDMPMTMNFRIADAWDEVELPQKLNLVPYKEEPWKTRYPQLANILNENPFDTKNQIIQKNLIYQCGNMEVSDAIRAAGVWKQNVETKDDPGFVDAAKFDYALKRNAEAFKLIPGFKPIPVSKIGLFKDKYRRKLP